MPVLGSYPGKLDKITRSKSYRVLLHQPGCCAGNGQGQDPWEDYFHKFLGSGCSFSEIGCLLGLQGWMKDAGKMFGRNPELREKALKLIPLGGMMTANQVAEAILTLCLPGADYMTGSTFLVDGGNSLFYRKED
jgi:hypothetical protein